MEEVGKLNKQEKYIAYRSSDDISLKQYIDIRFADMQKAVDLQSSIIQIAVDKAEQALSKRLDSAKDYADIRFTDVQASVDRRFFAHQLSLDKSEQELTRKLIRKERIC